MFQVEQHEGCILQLKLPEPGGTGRDLRVEIEPQLVEVPEPDERSRKRSRPEIPLGWLAGCTSFGPVRGCDPLGRELADPNLERHPAATNR